jgi:flagellar basal body-associated protein FliL
MMPEDEVVDEEQEEEEPAGGKKKKSGNLFIIIIGVVFIVGAGFFAFTMMGGDKEDEEVDLSQFEMYEFEEMVVNIPDSNFRLNLVAKICVKVPDLKVIEEITKHEAMFVDLLYKILGSKELKTLGPAGKEELRGEIRNAFNSRPELTEGEVMDVYFKNFMVGQ